MTEPRKLTLTFDITEGEVWIDPDDVAWHVKFADGLVGGVHMERTVATTEDPYVMIRKWRKMGEKHD